MGVVGEESSMALWKGQAFCLDLVIGVSLARTKTLVTMDSKQLTFEGIVFPPVSTFQSLKGRQKSGKDKAILLPGLQMLLLQCQDDLAIMALPGSLQQAWTEEQQANQMAGGCGSMSCFRVCGVSNSQSIFGVGGREEDVRDSFVLCSMLLSGDFVCPKIGAYDPIRKTKAVGTLCSKEN